MDCEKALLLISAALDGELTEEERRELEAHLAECPECRALSEDFGVLSVALSDMEAPPPEDLADRVSAALDVISPTTAVKTPTPWRRWGSLCAMLAVVVCVGGLYWATSSGMLALGGGSGSMPMPQPSGETATAADAAPRDSAPEAPEAAPSQNDDAVFYAASPTPEDGADGVKNEPTLAGGNDPLTTEGETPEEPALGPETGEELREPGEEPDPQTTVEPTGDPKTEPELVGIPPAQALELAFEYLGGLSAYPDALIPAEDPLTYRLAVDEEGDLVTRHMLVYEGLSPNNAYHLFRQYDYLVRGGEEGWAYTTTLNRYAVSLDGLTVYAEQDAPQAYHEAISELPVAEPQS